MAIVLDGTTGITTPNVSTDTSTLGPLTQALNLGSTGQIVFPATQNASANANTLDDYEEGTFTPALSSINNVPGLNGSQKAAYTKIGDVVTINLHLGASSVGAAAEFTFSLPFAMKTNSLGLSVFGFGFPYALDWRGSATTTTTVRTFATGTSAAAQDINICFSYQTAT
jgi:hypothetical protein